MLMPAVAVSMQVILGRAHVVSGTRADRLEPSVTADCHTSPVTLSASHSHATQLIHSQVSCLLSWCVVITSMWRTATVDEFWFLLRPGPPTAMQSIVMSFSVCVSVFLHVYLRNHTLNFTKFSIDVAHGHSMILFLVML